MSINYSTMTILVGGGRPRSPYRAHRRPAPQLVGAGRGSEVKETEGVSLPFCFEGSSLERGPQQDGRRAQLKPGRWPPPIQGASKLCPPGFTPSPKAAGVSGRSVGALDGRQAASPGLILIPIVVSAIVRKTAISQIEDI